MSEQQDAILALVAALETLVDHHTSGVCDDGWPKPIAYPSHPEWSHAAAMEAVRAALELPAVKRLTTSEGRDSVGGVRTK